MRKAWTIPKWCKAILALLLLPVCIGAAWTLALVVRASGGADTFWVAALCGAACWLIIYLLLPKPMWAYVFAHELTHVLWTLLFGGKVKRFKASARGGYVVVSKSNFLIALAPYFFPLYAFLAALIYAGGRRLWHWDPYVVWFHLGLGAAYAFHLTLTWHILKSVQPDITEQGYLFSGIIIFLGNVGVLLLAVPLLAGQVDLLTALRWWSLCTTQVIQWLAKPFH